MTTEHKPRIDSFLQEGLHMSWRNKKKVALIFMWVFCAYFDIYNYVES